MHATLNTSKQLLMQKIYMSRIDGLVPFSVRHGLHVFREMY